MVERKLFDRDLINKKIKEVPDGYLPEMNDDGNINNSNTRDKDRNKIRMFYTNIFGTEMAGNGEKVEYKYIVEEVNTNDDYYRIYLKRPARTNWGLDFTICVEHGDKEKDEYKDFKGFLNGTYRPSHRCILEDLIKKKKESEEGYQEAIKLIDRLYNEPLKYQNITDLKTDKNATIENIQDKYFKSSKTIPVELLLKIIKWLFIEQDMTYWLALGKTKTYRYFTSKIYFYNDGKIYEKYPQKKELKDVKINLYFEELETENKKYLENDNTNLILGLQGEKIFLRKNKKEIEEEEKKIKATLGKQSLYYDKMIPKQSLKEYSYFDNDKNSKHYNEIVLGNKKTGEKGIQLSKEEKIFANYLLKDKKYNLALLVSSNEINEEIEEKLGNSIIVIENEKVETFKSIK